VAHESGDDHDHDHGTEAARPPLQPGPVASRIVYLDCFSGIAGDMTLAALVDAGVPLPAIEERLGTLGVEGWRIVTRRVARSGIGALKLDVEIDPRQPERTWVSIRTTIEAAALPEGARARALSIFGRLAEAEARVHRIPVDEVHFHEVGAVDAIVDVCGTAIALDWLGAGVASAPVPHGRGFVQARHGVLPIPAPAALEALRDAPTYGVDVPHELATPTGAAIVGALAESFGPLPPMQIEAIGWGAGTAELVDRPNLLRVVVGRALAPVAAALVVLEANVDDMSPEIAGWLVERLLGAGALDAWLAPIQMKKGRPGVMVGVLARTADRALVESVLLAESTTIGVRAHAVDRRELPRHIETVSTPYGQIPVKVATDGLAHNAAPEFEACRRAAEEHGVPLKDVYARALAAYWAGR
jgi:uncharacterized protein (TIGR00299 family) protein